jgi:hypothetical protein
VPCIATSRYSSVTCMQTDATQGAARYCEVLQNSCRECRHRTPNVSLHSSCATIGASPLYTGECHLHRPGSLVLSCISTAMLSLKLLPLFGGGAMCTPNAAAAVSRHRIRGDVTTSCGARVSCNVTNFVHSTMHQPGNRYGMTWTAELSCLADERRSCRM